MDLITGFFIFGSLCVSLEIFFTSLKKLFSKNHPKTLQGESYFWMFYIYGSATILFHFFFPVIQDWFILFRLLFYGLIILLAEYIYGFILKTIISKCPWHYSSKFSVNGLIRLDYLPIWMLVGWILEIVYINF